MRRPTRWCCLTISTLKGHNVSAGEACPSAGASITGVAFYAGGRYPSRFNGALFFADYTRRCIWVMTAGVGGLPDPATRAPFVTAAAYPVDLQVGPDGDLFYVDFTGGMVHRIAYSAQNTPPRAAALAVPASGLAPLTVQFDGTASSDAEDGTLTFDWDLTGDGVFGDSALGRPTYTYGANGTRTVSLRVTDSGGLSDVVTLPVVVGHGTGSPHRHSACNTAVACRPEHHLQWACERWPTGIVAGRRARVDAGDESLPDVVELPRTSDSDRDRGQERFVRGARSR